MPEVTHEITHLRTQSAEGTKSLRARSNPLHEVTHLVGYFSGVRISNGMEQPTPITQELVKVTLLYMLPKAT